MSPADRAKGAGWVRADRRSGAEWWTGPGDDASRVVWDCHGLTWPRDCWCSLGPSPAKRQEHPDEDAALAAALAAWGVA